MLVDSHCHLNMIDLTLFNDDLENVLAAARKMDISHLLCACCSFEEFPKILSIAKQHEMVSCSVGVHPTEQEGLKPTLDTLTKYAKEPEVVAIGETGLDFSYVETDFERQQHDFRLHIQAAKAVNKPLIIHTRQAAKETMTILREEKAETVRGVMHCFTETWEMAKEALDLGFYISISGIVTFKNAEQVREVAKQVPEDRLLVETDAPWLAPIPYRGKPNEPAYVRYVAEYIANLRHISFKQIAEQTTRNYYNLMGKRNV